MSATAPFDLPITRLRPSHPIPVQEPGCGALGRLCRAGIRVRGLLHTEPEEGGIASARKLKADAAVDHRYRIRSHGEGCEGLQVT